MDWGLIIVVELLVIGGAAFVILVAREGIRAVERKERAAQEPLSPRVSEVPAFFSEPASKRLENAAARLDDLAFRRFQEYLEAEQALVEKFVSEPSVASLYREAEHHLTLN